MPEIAFFVGSNPDFAAVGGCPKMCRGGRLPEKSNQRDKHTYHAGDTADDGTDNRITKKMYAKKHTAGGKNNAKAV